MSARINGQASGVWSAEEGTAVEIIDYKANGRAVLVQMPPDAKLAKKAGRQCWIPRSWVDGEQPAPTPRVCPACGRPLPEED